jgi:hypothetical protein
MARKVESVNLDETLRSRVGQLGVKNFSKYVEELIIADLAERLEGKQKKDRKLRAWQERLAVLGEKWDALQGVKS